MSDFERVDSEEREPTSSPKSSRRFNMGIVIPGVVAAGLAAVVLAHSVRGGNGEYDQATKDSLQAALRPTAVRIAGDAIKTPSGWQYRDGNRVVIEISDEVPPVGEGPRSYPYTSMDLRVTTGTTDGRPDPEKVESVSISSGRFGNSRAVHIDSPRSDNLPNSFFTGGEDYSGHGAWSGSVIELNGQFMARAGLQANTENALAASDDLSVIDRERDARIQTADMIAAMADRLDDRLYGQNPHAGR
jgi:hypothetical protein